MEILLYNITDMPNVVSKTLGDAVTVDGVLRTAFNTINPTVAIRLDSVPTYNYCYISDFNRYYFIQSFTLTNKNEYTFALKEDVLMTYKDYILNATGNVEESEDDDYVNTNSKPYDVRPNFDTLEFTGNEDVLTDTGSIVMITIKGT